MTDLTVGSVTLKPRKKIRDDLPEIAKSTAKLILDEAGCYGYELSRDSRIEDLEFHILLWLQRLVSREGSECSKECGGTMYWPAIEDCSCHHPHGCIHNVLTCDKCGCE